MKCPIIVGLVSLLGAAAASADEVPVPMQQGTATYTQVLPACSSHTPDASVDGDVMSRNGWAISTDCHATDACTDQTAVWETVSDFSSSELHFLLHQNVENLHYMGRFRLSITSDDRSTFADDLDTGGDVTATWTVLASPEATGPAGMTFTVLGDGSILAGGSPPVSSALYEVRYRGAFFDVTGVRLEMIEHPSLPFDGPGLQPTNGNFVLSEIQLFYCQPASRAGNVDTKDGGPPVDLMFVNGSAGDPVDRKVTVTAGVPVTLHVEKAPSIAEPKGGYGFWIFEGDLRGCVDVMFRKPTGALYTLGEAGGCMPINNTLAPGTCPCPATLGTTSRRLSVAKSDLLCLARPNSPRSPVDLPVTFPPGTFTILSLHQDRNSPSSPGKNIGIGNTIVVVSEP